MSLDCRNWCQSLLELLMHCSKSFFAFETRIILRHFLWIFNISWIKVITNLTLALLALFNNWNKSKFYYFLLCSSGIIKGREKRYKKFNNIAERIATVDTYCMICTLSMIFTGPAITNTYNYYTKGNFTINDLRIPVEIE